MVSTIEHPIAAWVHGFVMRRVGKSQCIIKIVKTMERIAVIVASCAAIPKDLGRVLRWCTENADVFHRSAKRYWKCVKTNLVCQWDGFILLYTARIGAESIKIGPHNK